jgi:hypothetical protein
VTVTVTVDVTVTVTVTVIVTGDDQRLVLHGGDSVQQAGQSWSSFGSCTCRAWKKVSITVEAA